MELELSVKLWMQLRKESTLNSSLDWIVQKRGERYNEVEESKQNQMRNTSYTDNQVFNESPKKNIEISAVLSGILSITKLLDDSACNITLFLHSKAIATYTPKKKKNIYVLGD